MKSADNLIRIGCFSGDFLKERFSPNFDNSSHVMPIKSMRNLIFLTLALELKLNFLTKMICFGGFSLFNNNLDHVLPFEYLIANHRNVHYTDLNHNANTSYLLKKSTGGIILSASVLMKSRNSSLCFRFISCPKTCPSLSSIPIYMVPPFEFKNPTKVLRSIHLCLESLTGR